MTIRSRVSFVPLLVLIALVPGLVQGADPFHAGARRQFQIGGGIQRFDVTDEITSPLEWGGSGEMIHIGFECPNRWGYFTLQFTAGKANLDWNGYDGTGVIHTGDGGFYRKHTTRYAEILNIGVEQNFRLDSEGAWRWWLGSALWIRSEQTAPTPEGIFDYQGYGGLTLGPVLRPQWLPGWDLDIRGYMGVPLFGWIVRGPWSGFHPDYQWTREIDFRFIGQFLEIRSGLAVRRGIWKSLGLEMAYDVTWSANDLSREYRSVSQAWRLDLLVGW